MICEWVKVFRIIPDFMIFRRFAPIKSKGKIAFSGLRTRFQASGISALSPMYNNVC